MPTIGDNVGRIRRQRGMTQEQLAEQAGISVEVIRKLERNERTSPRMETLGALARALRVPTTALVGDGSIAAARGEAGGRQLGLLDLRRALTPPRGLAGPVLDARTSPPPPVDDVRAQLRIADQAYHRGDYAAAVTAVPRLLDDARAAAEAAADGASRPWATLAQAYYLTCELLIQLRAGDLAYQAASSALDAAQRAGDQVLAASTVKGSTWLLLRQGRLADAERVAVATADAIEPKMSRARPDELAVWGWLLLAGAAAAARDQRPDDAAEMLDAAAAGAARIGGRPLGGDHLAIVGGLVPARVEMMRVEAAAVSGDPARVLELAGGVPEGQTLPTSWRRHRLDVAWAYVETARYAEATEVLMDLRDRAPDWLRHQRYARRIVTTIATERRRAMSRELASLSDLVGAIV